MCSINWGDPANSPVGHRSFLGYGWRIVGDKLGLVASTERILASTGDVVSERLEVDASIGLTAHAPRLTSQSDC